MNLYPRQMIHSFKKLETKGIAINGNEHVSRGFLYASLVMNCKQFNGAFSCMRCMDP